MTNTIARIVGFRINHALSSTLVDDPDEELAKLEKLSTHAVSDAWFSTCGADSTRVERYWAAKLGSLGSRKLDELVKPPALARR